MATTGSIKTMTDLQFQLPGVQDWEARLQVTFLAPREDEVDLNLPVDVTTEPPLRSNIVASRVLTEATDPRMECEKFIQEVAKSVPNLEHVGERIMQFDFEDKTRGAMTKVKFPASPGVTLMQLHAFRIDAHVLTQLVVTVDEALGEGQLDDLANLLRGFSPGSTEQS